MSTPHPSTRCLTIDRQRAEFADREFEDRFIRHFLPERNAQLKASLLFSAVFYVAFGLTDIATLGPTATAWAMVALRFVVALAALGACAAIARYPDSVPVSIRATCSVLVAGLAAFPVLCWYQPAAMVWNLMSYMDSSSFANNPFSGREVRLLTYIRSRTATPVPGAGP